jgi:hypothetical protein
VGSLCGAGQCCAGEVDAERSCCDGTVDACGICNGEATACYGHVIISAFIAVPAEENCGAVELSLFGSWCFNMQTAFCKAFRALVLPELALLPVDSEEAMSLESTVGCDVIPGNVLPTGALQQRRLTESPPEATRDKTSQVLGDADAPNFSAWQHSAHTREQSSTLSQFESQHSLGALLQGVEAFALVQSGSSLGSEGEEWRRGSVLGSTIKGASSRHLAQAPAEVPGVIPEAAPSGALPETPAEAPGVSPDAAPSEGLPEALAESPEAVPDVMATTELSGRTQFDFVLKALRFRLDERALVRLATMLFPGKHEFVHSNILASFRLNFFA